MGTELKKTEEEKSRDYLFDNIRAILIFTVVFAHMIADRLKQWDVMMVLYFFIYFFHMPAFVFITGYFSKNVEKCRKTAVRTFLLPYIIINILSFVFHYYIFQYGKGLDTSFFNFKVSVPRWGIWYLFALFIWRFLLTDLSKIKGILWWSLLLGLGCGLFPDFDSQFALGRVFGFGCFFIAGYVFQKEQLEKIRKIPVLFGYFILVGVGIFTYFCTKYGWIIKETLYCRQPYKKGEVLSQLIMRGEYYIIAFLLIFALLIVVGRKQTFLSKIGQNTLTIYVLHLFTVDGIDRLEILTNYPKRYFVFSIVVSVVMVYLYSRPFVKKGYYAFMGLFERLLFQKEEKIPPSINEK